MIFHPLLVSVLALSTDTNNNDYKKTELAATTTTISYHYSKLVDGNNGMEESVVCRT